MCQKVKQLVIESYLKSDLMTSVPAFAQIVTYYTFLKCSKSLETHRSDYRLLLWYMYVHGGTVACVCGGGGRENVGQGLKQPYTRAIGNFLLTI